MQTAPVAQAAKTTTKTTTKAAAGGCGDGGGGGHGHSHGHGGHGHSHGNSNHGHASISISDEEAKEGGQGRGIIKTTMLVNGICCPSEVPIIEKILNPLPGVKSVRINVIAKKVAVEHDEDEISALAMVLALNRARLDASIFGSGKDSGGEGGLGVQGAKLPKWNVMLGAVCWITSMVSHGEAEPHNNQTQPGYAGEKRGEKKRGEKRRGEERREEPAQPTGVVCGVQ